MHHFTALFSHCTLQIQSFSNTQTNAHTFEHSANWIRFVRSVKTKYGDNWIRRYSFNENICLEIGLWASYLPGEVWTFHRIHSVFAWKRSSMHKHCFSSSNTETSKYGPVRTRPWCAHWPSYRRWLNQRAPEIWPKFYSPFLRHALFVVPATLQMKLFFYYLK